MCDSIVSLYIHLGTPQNKKSSHVFLLTRCTVYSGTLANLTKWLPSVCISNTTKAHGWVHVRALPCIALRQPINFKGLLTASKLHQRRPHSHRAFCSVHPSKTMLTHTAMHRCSMQAIRLMAIGMQWLHRLPLFQFDICVGALS